MVWVARSIALAADALMTSPESQHSKAWRERMQELRAIRGYRDDWDGLGAQAPGPDLTDDVEAILRSCREDPSLPAPDRILATPDGGVAVEWQLGSTVLEVEFTASGVAEFMHSVSGAQTKQWTMPFANNSQRALGWASATA